MDTKQIVEELIIKHDSNNPFVIADNLGIPVIYRNMKNVLGFFNMYKRIKIIHLNNNLSEKLETFVCAHELCHAIKHYDRNTPFLKRHTLFSTDKIEQQANTFAVELLMPDSLLRESECSIYRMAEVLGIPEKLADLKRKD
ncbi:Metallopeptidase ImmA [Sporomusa ovata DSM 2662]|uniref:Phage protein n=1 Tax=Sporomusa ovata TaxID=2378 RepID=A0A0U1KW44_9FIRM|nr:ImmA/IrrE family metallo-endopeptidase [Sporomusa ovata]EQB28110.1 putative Zn peptidase [Sporomusa ovata DSM 2662]CQR71647.1 Phage protein [Sporomusa ovata]